MPVGWIPESTRGFGDKTGRSADLLSVGGEVGSTGMAPVWQGRGLLRRWLDRPGWAAGAAGAGWDGWDGWAAGAAWAGWDAGIGGHPHPGYPPVVQRCHNQPALVVLHRLPQSRHMPQGGHDEACHCLVRAVGQAGSTLLGELVQVEQAVDLDVAAAQRAGLLAFHVVLVPNVADQVLDQVLESDDAGGSAVLVHDDRQVVTLAAHLRQGNQHLLRRR